MRQRGAGGGATEPAATWRPSSGVRLALAMLLAAPFAAACWTPTCVKAPAPSPFHDEPLGFRCRGDGDCRQGRCAAGNDRRFCEVPAGWLSGGGTKRTGPCSRDEDCNGGKCVTAAPAVSACAVGGGPCPAGAVPSEGAPWRLTGTEPASACLTACQADADCRLGTIAGVCRAWGQGPETRSYCLIQLCERDDDCPAGYRCVGGLIRAGGLRSATSSFECRGGGFCQRTAVR